MGGWLGDGGWLGLDDGVWGGVALGFVGGGGGGLAGRWERVRGDILTAKIPSYGGWGYLESQGS